jgi:hypothetical protein
MEKAYKFIKEGLGKFTAIEKAIKKIEDFWGAVREADETGKAYFISAIIDGFEYRAIAWNGKAGLDKGSWSHKVPTTLDELRALAGSDDMLFKYAYAQYRIKLDAEAVKPKSLDAAAKEASRKATERATLIKKVVDGIRAMVAGGIITPEGVEDTAIAFCTGSDYLAEVAKELGLDISVG